MLQAYQLELVEQHPVASHLLPGFGNELYLTSIASMSRGKQPQEPEWMARPSGDCCCKTSRQVESTITQPLGSSSSTRSPRSMIRIF